MTPSQIPNITGQYPNWKTRKLEGLKEKITTGAQRDTIIMMEPTDLVYSKGQQETFTSAQLQDYISKQIDRGSSNVVQLSGGIITNEIASVFCIVHPHNHWFIRYLLESEKEEWDSNMGIGLRP